MKKYKLVSVLFLISTICFWFCIIWFSFIVVYDVFADAKLNDNFKVTPNHITGYAVPVKIQLNTHDSIIDFQNKKHYGEISIKDLKEPSYKATHDSIFHSKNYSHTLINSKLTSQRHNLLASESQTPRIDSAEGYIIVNPKNQNIAMIIAFKNYFLAFISILILWLLKSFFRDLNQKFEFSPTSRKKIRAIAFVILTYQIINFIITSIISYYGTTFYNYITADDIKITSYSVRAVSEINFTFIIVALSLLVISKLLSYGYELQQENDLTV